MSHHERSRVSAGTPIGYNTPIPAQIMTPDRVETTIGRLDFVDGVPTTETAQRVFDNLDRSRGVKAFLDGIPAASVEAMRRANESMGVVACHKVLIMDQLLDSNPLFLTGNTDTVYVSGILDLERDGPTVVEVPPACGPGTVNDAWFRFVVDMGAPGPDRGAGGKYLILPPGYEDAVPEGYFVSRSTSRINWLILRGFLVDGKPDAAIEMFRSGLRVYPLSMAAAPPSMEFISGSGVAFNTIHANDFSFFEEVASVIEREPVDMLDPELRGLFAALGIQKDRPFQPDERWRSILADAAAVGNATARAIFFHDREPDAYVFPDRSWTTPFIGGDYRWLIEDGLGGRHLDARTLFFYVATVNTPAMALEMVGLGSQYVTAVQDSDGAFFDGGASYRLHLPPEVPAKDFWSVVVYDPQTRSELQTGQAFPGRNDKRDKLTYNPDGSVDILFGPQPPAEHAENWIETVPGKGWFVILRLYGPLQPWFDQSWMPGDVERV